MSPAQQKLFIETELYHELCCLLEAATLWRILKDSRIAGCEISIAMDSAFIHARNLFIFFAPTDDDKRNKNNTKMTEFGPKKVFQSRVYSDSKSAINRHLFHLNKQRLKPNNIKGSGPINEKVPIFADEILKLWKVFENDDGLGDLKGIAQQARERAEQDAFNTAHGRIALILNDASVPQSQSSVPRVDESSYVS